MPTDFDSCRFDFRLDNKKGLTPSRRRRTESRNATGSATSIASRLPASDGDFRSAATPGGEEWETTTSGCATFYTCKLCGCLLRSRADRLAHTLTHAERAGKGNHRQQRAPRSCPLTENRPPRTSGACSTALRTAIRRRSNRSEQANALSPTTTFMGRDELPAFALTSGRSAISPEVEIVSAPNNEDGVTSPVSLQTAPTTFRLCPTDVTSPTQPIAVPFPGYLGVDASLLRDAVVSNISDLQDREPCPESLHRRRLPTPAWESPTSGPLSGRESSTAFDTDSGDPWTDRYRINGSLRSLSSEPEVVKRHSPTIDPPPPSDGARFRASSQIQRYFIAMQAASRHHQLGSPADVASPPRATGDESSLGFDAPLAAVADDPSSSVLDFSTKKRRPSDSDTADGDDDERPPPPPPPVVDERAASVPSPRPDVDAIQPARQPVGPAAPACKSRSELLRTLGTSVTRKRKAVELNRMVERLWQSKLSVDVDRTLNERNVDEVDDVVAERHASSSCDGGRPRDVAIDLLAGNYDDNVDGTRTPPDLVLLRDGSPSRPDRRTQRGGADDVDGRRRSPDECCPLPLGRLSDFVPPDGNRPGCDVPLPTTVSESGAARRPGDDENEGKLLLLRRVVAAPGSHPQFFTSLMRLQSAKRKPTARRRQKRPVRVNRGGLLPSIPDHRGRSPHDTDSASLVCLAEETGHFSPETTSDHGITFDLGGLVARGDDDCELLDSRRGQPFTSGQWRSPDDAVSPPGGHATNCCREVRRDVIWSQSHGGLDDVGGRLHEQEQVDAYVTTDSEHSEPFPPADRDDYVDGGDVLDSVADRLPPILSSGGVSVDDLDVSPSTSGSSQQHRLIACDFPGCRRSFRELKHLKVHRMQHTDERPLACVLCDYTCRQRNSLNWHMKSRHGMRSVVKEDGRTVYV